MSDQTDVQPAGAISEEEMNRVLEELCVSKAEEFNMLGYEQVNGEDVWNCVSEKYRDSIPALHKVVNDILSLKVTQLMNWMTLSAFKSSQLPNQNFRDLDGLKLD